jgi:hypothetical protein
LVTYAVVDARTGSMLSSHPSLDAARAGLPQPESDRSDSAEVAIYVFDDTGHASGQCACADCD